MKRKFSSALLTLVLLFASACAPTPTPANNDAPIGKLTDYRSDAKQTLAKNSPAPNFQYQMPDGKEVFLSDLKGKVVLLNFWATWCPYCVIEMPLLEKVHQELKGKGLIMLGIDAGETESTVQKFVSEKKLTFTMILDPDLYASLLYDARYLPTTYIIDKTGKIQSLKIGAFKDDIEITSAIKPLLEQ